MIHKHRTVPCCVSFIVGLTYELIENMKILAEKIVVGNDLKKPSQSGQMISYMSTMSVV